jgi:hypothetical protein
MKERDCRFIPVIFLASLSLLLFVGCGSSPTEPTITPTATQDTFGLSEDAFVTLRSVEQVDDYPLFIMHYQGGYDQAFMGDLPVTIPDLGQACSLFAALGNPGELLYGRNFDWGGSPALLLFTDPPDGYASVSMVNIDYLTSDVVAARHPTTLALKDRQFLLSAPFMPIDGMNEYGLAIAMAAVSISTGGNDPNKPTIGSLPIMREILDHARTTQEAVTIISAYNIDFTGGPPIHYLIADRNGKAVLIEYYQDKMHILPNEDPWHIATNYLRCTPSGDGGCVRFNRINERFTETGGILNPAEAMALLKEVSQPNTDWSMLYEMSSGEISIVLGRHYETIYNYHLDLVNR